LPHDNFAGMTLPILISTEAAFASAVHLQIAIHFAAGASAVHIAARFSKLSPKLSHEVPGVYFKQTLSQDIADQKIGHGIHCRHAGAAKDISITEHDGTVV
jgi:hypothetical protein